MKLMELSVDNFMDELASDSPAPGGGSMAALTGCSAAALCAMVARLTIGREKYKDVWEAMEHVRDQADELIAEFKSLVDWDTEAFNKVMKAYRLPRQTPEESIKRHKAIDEATKGAAMVPLETLNAVGKLMDLVTVALEMGNRNCITDAGTALHLAQAAAMGASFNIRVNLKSIEDREFSSVLMDEAERVLTRVNQTVASLEGYLDKALR